MLKLLGLKRRPQDVTPTLQSYLEAVRKPDASDQEKDNQN
jgi:hypothetical protein